MAAQNLTLIAALALAVVPVHASMIANWKQMNPGLSGTNSGMDTNSPTIGDGTAENADDAWVAGRFGTVASPESVSLAVGETLTVSGSVTFTGGTGSAEQFRFGVFDGGAAFAADNNVWANGGWLYTPPGLVVTGGMYQARTDGVFVSTSANAVLLTSANTNTGGAFSADSATPYNWSFSITRASETTVDLFASLTGGPNAVNYARSVENQTTSLFTYSTVGLLFGSLMNLDQGVISNVQYTVVPAGGGNPVPVITAISLTGNTATVVMTGAAGTDYYCAGSADLAGWTTEIVPTSTPGSPFQTDANGDLTFTIDTSLLPSSYFFRVQDTDPSP